MLLRKKVIRKMNSKNQDVSNPFQSLITTKNILTSKLRKLMKENKKLKIKLKNQKMTKKANMKNISEEVLKIPLLSMSQHMAKISQPKKNTSSDSKFSLTRTPKFRSGTLIQKIHIPWATTNIQPGPIRS